MQLLDYVRGVLSLKRREIMSPVNSFDDYSPWADSTETISRLDRIACLFIVILHRKYSQRCNKVIYTSVSF